MSERLEKLEPALVATAQAAGADSALVARIRRAIHSEERRRNEAFLNAGEVAQRLNWHRKTVLRHARELGAVWRSKRTIRFPLSAVEKFEGGF